MSKILKTHPKSVQGHKDLILRCLDDPDESIRLRSLDLLYGMVTKKNLMEIVKKLMVHMDRAEGTTYRDELMFQIIQICSQNDYQVRVFLNFESVTFVIIDLQVENQGDEGPWCYFQNYSQRAMIWEIPQWGSYFGFFHFNLKADYGENRFC